jgi:hypothetical protein
MRCGVALAARLQRLRGYQALTMRPDLQRDEGEAGKYIRQPCEDNKRDTYRPVYPRIEVFGRFRLKSPRC